MKKRHLVYGALMILATLVPVAATADGWYWGLLLGGSNYNARNDGRDTISASFAQQGFPAATSASDNPVAAGFSFGYHFNPNFALEFGYADLGEARSTVSNVPPNTGSYENHVDAYGDTIDAIGAIPFGDSFALFAKGGFFLYGVDSHTFGPGGPQFDSVTSSTYDFGVGASFGLNDYTSLRLGYTRFHNVGDPGFLGEGAVGLAYAQLVFNFGRY